MAPGPGAAEPTTSSRAATGLTRLGQSRHLAPLAVVVLAVIAANAAYLLGIFDPNPVNLYAGLSDLTHPGVLTGLPSADPNSGITSQALGHLVAVDWLHGHVPWWNPYEGLGAPLAGEMQAAAFFPPTLLLYFSNGQIYLHLLLELTAGVSTYALLVRLRLARVVAVCGAIAFALCGTFSWFSHAPVNPVPFLPLILLGIELATDAERARRRRGWIALALGVALSIYAGFPETAYIDGVLAGVWAVARFAELPAERRGRFVGTLAVAVVAGALLAAPILVAFADYVAVGDLGGHSGGFGRVSLTAPAASQLFLPYVYGPIDAFSSNDTSGVLGGIWGNVGGYLTISLLPLGLLGAAGALSAARRGHRALRAVLFLWLLLALGRTFGLGPLHALVNALPGMKDVAFYRYSDPTWAMALVVLAAFGFDDLVQGRVARRTIALASAISLVVVALSVVEARGLWHQIASAPDHRLWALASSGWALALVVAIGLVALVARGRVRRYVIAAIVIVDSVAMFVVPELSAPRASAYYPAPVRSMTARLGDARFYTVGPIPPNYGSYYALSSLNSLDVPQPNLYESYLLARLHVPTGSGAAAPVAVANFFAHLPGFEASGVKFLVTPGDFQLPPDEAARLRLVSAGPSGNVYELPHPGALYVLGAPRCRVSAQTFDSATVGCRRATTLVRRELFMSGWTVTVNGTGEGIRQDGAFQAVHLPAGRTTVVFAFTPPSMNLALAGLLVGLAALLAVLLRPLVPLARPSRGRHVSRHGPGEP